LGKFGRAPDTPRKQPPLAPNPPQGAAKKQIKKDLTGIFYLMFEARIGCPGGMIDHFLPAQSGFPPRVFIRLSEPGDFS